MHHPISCATNSNWSNEVLESVKCLGYAVLHDVLSTDETKAGADALYRIRPLIAAEVGSDRLARANEEGVLRLPMKFDPVFFKLLQTSEMLSVVDSTVSDTAILHLQNGFIFPSHKRGDSLELFQYKFHKDFSRTLNGYMASINVLFSFTDLTEDSEGFYVVPGSHQKSYQLDEAYCKSHAVPVVCPAGSALIFDSTLWHCGGPNYSSQDWLGVNHQFTRSYIKQQIDYVRALGDQTIEMQPPRVQQLLGWYTRVVTSLNEYYRPEEKRLYRRGQG